MTTRADIREAARAAIRSAVSATVGHARGDVYNREDLPAIEVSTPAESQALDTGDGFRRLETTLRITGFATQGAQRDVEAELDALLSAARAAVLGDWTFQGMHKGVLSVETQFDIGERGEAAPARLDMDMTLLRFMED